MPGTRELTRRIKSIKSTRKITRAMQLVSAAKMRKAQNATLKSRTYAENAWQLIAQLSNETLLQHPLIKSYPGANKILAIIISSNRGLVGGFNSNLLFQLKALETGESQGQLELVVLGKKAKDSLSRLRKNLIADFPKTDNAFVVKKIYPIAKLLSDLYSSGQYKKIFVIYNHYVSTLVQKTTSKQLLPLPNARNLEQAESKGDYLLEPDETEVVNQLAPRIVESQLYQAILESDASEHSARMVMMKNATDAAGDLVDDLTLTYNQLRQNKITTELSEITAGRIALE